MMTRLPILITALVLTACGTCGLRDLGIDKIKPGMTSKQVEEILGLPAKIEHAETSDLNLSGDVYHYVAPNGEGRVVFINHSVFKAELIPKAKS